MKLLVLFATLLMAQSAFAINNELGIRCTVKLDQNRTLEVAYWAPQARMELTQSNDGTKFGSSYGGMLLIKNNGRQVLNITADAAAEEYGVIIDNNEMIYANLSVEGASSDEESFSLTFGLSYDDKKPTYTTDSKNSLIGGVDGSPKTHPADCTGY